jgi:predicted RNase H-like HicB family nuclease
MMMHKYLVIIERTPTGFSAYSPDLPGCIATGKSRKAVHVNMQSAIEFHIAGLKAEGSPVPEPSTESAYLVVQE